MDSESASALAYHIIGEIVQVHMHEDEAQESFLLCPSPVSLLQYTISVFLVSIP